MYKEKISTLLIGFSFVVTLLLVTIGISFAYFTANITGTEDITTINISGGVMNIHYHGGDNIEAFNISPDNAPFGTKNFTATGYNNTSMEMNYHIVLVIEENTFTSDAIMYQLITENTDGNGSVPLSMSDLKGIESGSGEIILGNANFSSPTDGNKVHTYNLELYFPEKGVSQNENQGKIFKAFVSVRS